MRAFLFFSSSPCFPRLSQNLEGQFNNVYPSSPLFLDFRERKLCGLVGSFIMYQTLLFITWFGFDLFFGFLLY